MSEQLTGQEMIEQYQAAMACFPESLLIRMQTIMAVNGQPDTLDNRVCLLVRTIERMAALLAQCAADGQNIGIEL